MLDEIFIEIVFSKMVKDCRGPSVLGNDDILLLSFLEDDLDEYLLEHDPKFRKLIERRWKEYVAHGGLPLEQVLKRIPK